MRNVSLLVCAFFCAIFSSCVQGDDLFDIYEDEDLSTSYLLTRNKNTKADQINSGSSSGLGFCNKYYEWTCTFIIAASMTNNETVNGSTVHDRYMTLIREYIKANFDAKIKNEYYQTFCDDDHYLDIYAEIIFGKKDERPANNGYNGLADNELCSLINYQEVIVESFSAAKQKYQDVTKRKLIHPRIFLVGDTEYGRHIAEVTGFYKDGSPKTIEVDPSLKQQTFRSVSKVLIPK